MKDLLRCDAPSRNYCRPLISFRDINVLAARSDDAIDSDEICVDRVPVTRMHAMQFSKVKLCVDFTDEDNTNALSDV
jgi:hypothetical protein